MTECIRTSPNGVCLQSFCTSSTCTSDNVCINTTQSYVCQTDYCLQSPCENGALCNNIVASAISPGYKCSCAVGYTDYNCSSVIQYNSFTASSYSMSSSFVSIESSSSGSSNNANSDLSKSLTNNTSSQTSSSLIVIIVAIIVIIVLICISIPLVYHLYRRHLKRALERQQVDIQMISVNNADHSQMNSSVIVSKQQNSHNKYSTNSNINSMRNNSSIDVYNNSNQSIGHAIPNFNTLSQFNQSALVSDIADNDFDNKKSFAYAHVNDHISTLNHMNT